MASIPEIHERELQRFLAARPKSIEAVKRASAHMPNGAPMSWMASENELALYVDRGKGSGFTDIDGNHYVDFNAADMAMFCGHANPAIIRAVQDQVTRSTQFLLATENSIDVAEELARRYPVPMWQFTLSASQANTEAMRVARAATGRDVVVLFRGHYHGHFDEGLQDFDPATGAAGPVDRGLPAASGAHIRIARFNDPDSLREALAPRDVAMVLTEPAMTNYLHFLAPQPGWHDALRQITRDHGTLLTIDETHTHVVGYGGATGLWGLEPDIVTIGKAVAGGLPMGAYGMREELAAQIDETTGEGIASGGTLFGNPLSAAGAKAALTEVLTPEAYASTTALGNALADGIEAAIADAGLDWSVIRFGPRTGQWFGPEPKTRDEAYALLDKPLARAMRLYMANRGIWEAIVGAGPTVIVPATQSDVDLYLEAYRGFLSEIS